MDVANPTTTAEVGEWGFFTATRGFGHRPGAIGRFYAKFVCDPTGDRDLIVVAKESGRGEIAGGLRVFQRAVFLQGAYVPMYGIGEVCSDPDQRGKGVAGKLLTEALRLMVARTQGAVSFLHAAESVRGMYAKFGWSAIPCPYGSIATAAPVLAPGVGTGSVGHTYPLGASADDCEASKPESACTVLTSELIVERAGLQCQWQRLQQLHVETVVRLGARGTVERGEEYWTRWIPGAASGWAGSESIAEVDDVAARSAAHAAHHKVFIAVDGESKEILAFACIQWKSDLYRVMDWGCMPFTREGAWTGAKALQFLRTVWARSAEMDSLRHTASTAVQVRVTGLSSAVDAATGVMTADDSSSAMPTRPRSSYAAPPQHLCQKMYMPTLLLQEIVAACAGVSSQAGTGQEGLLASLGVQLEDAGGMDDGWCIRSIEAQQHDSLQHGSSSEGDKGVGAAGVQELKQAAMEGKFLMFAIDGF